MCGEVLGLPGQLLMALVLALQMERQMWKLENPPLDMALAKVPRSEMVLGAGRASSKP